MFGALRKVFIQETEVFESNESDENDERNPSFIVEPAKIINLLHQIIESPPLCTASIRHSSKAFFTSLLEIQPDKGTVLFDKLFPPSGNSLISQFGVVKISTYIGGVHLTFDLEGITQEKINNQPVYKALIPKSIYYPQRRASPRFQTDSSAIEFQGTSKNTGLLIKGNVLDISRTGLCLTFLKNGSTIQSGDTLTNCLIRLPDESTFAFELTIRSIRKGSSTSLQSQIGGHFKELSTPNQNKLDRAICALERRQIRKRKN